MGHTPLTDTDVRKIARLARLAISDAEVSQHREALSAVIGYMDTLRAVDLSGAGGGGGTHAGSGLDGGDGSGSHLAADEPGEMLSNESLMNMAPMSLPPFVLVPKVLDDGGGGGGA